MHELPVKRDVDVLRPKNSASPAVPLEKPVPVRQKFMMQTQRFKD